jgi:nucleoside-diphosphate-sugar epimerase
MATLTIFGGNSLLGQHVINDAIDSKKFGTLRVWNFHSKPEIRLESNNNPETSIEYFNGFESIERIVDGANAVINVHDCHDFSVKPDAVEMEEHNVYFIQRLLDACQKGDVRSLVHLSSIFLQCTSLFPNVNSRELKPLTSKFVPFKPYVGTKRRAEDLLMNHHSDLQIVIGRCGGLSGEGDVASPICDAIYLSDKLGYLPILGDRGGVYQMAYAGNIASSMIEILSHLEKNVSVRHEIVILRDETPNQDIYSSTLIPILSSTSRPISSSSLPFFLFFPILCIIAGLNWICNTLGFSTRLNNLPDPVYVYFILRHWTFFSDFKQRILFGQTPKYSYDESKSRCIEYYSNLSSDKIRNMSWQKCFY